MYVFILLSSVMKKNWHLKPSIQYILNNTASNVIIMFNTIEHTNGLEIKWIKYVSL